jgi:TP901 family phage tail tape measure protein
MALDAGSVFTTLGFKTNPAGLRAYESEVKRAAAAGDAAEARMVSASDRVSKAHERIASSAGKVAQSSARLSEAIPLRAMDQWSKSSDQAGKNLAKLGTVATKGAAIGILSLGAATVYAATKAVTFNREMLKISTQAGASTAEVKSMSKAVLAMAGTVPQGPQKLAEGLYHIESAGFRGAKALEMLKGAAQGAALGNADLQATTQAMIATMASHIKGVHGSADAMGQLNAIVGVGDMRMEQLAQAMATGILPTAHDAGLSLKDVGAALATVTDNATPANVTATRLRMTLALMAAPSAAAQKQLASIGLTSTSLAHDMRQPNGLLMAIEDLKTHLRGSGKSLEEQDAVLSKVFGGGKSSAVIHTLISETDRLRAKYQELGAIDGPKRLAKSWSEFQQSNSATFGELKSGAEAFAITVGDVVLPQLAKMAHGLQGALAGFVSSGGAAKAGQAIQDVFSTLGQVVSNVAGPLKSIAEGLLAVGKAAGLGNAGELTALIAGFAAFKGLGFVAPILTAIAAGISEVGVAAATAPSIAAFGGDLVALAGGPMSAIVLGLSVAVGAFVAFESGLFSSASAAEKNASALEKDASAVKALEGASTKSANAQLAASRAQLTHKEAAEGLKRVEKEIADGHLKGAAATNALLSAQLSSVETAGQLSAAKKKAVAEIEGETHAQEKAKDVATSRQAEIFKEIELTNKQITAARQSHASKAELGSLLAKLATQQQDYNNRGKEAAQVMAEIAVMQESTNRALKGKGAIESKNAVGVQQLQNALFESGAPKKIVTKYELDDQGAQAKLGALAASLTALGQHAVVAKVLTTAPSAGAAILALRAVIAGVPSKKVVAILHNAPSVRAAMSALAGAIRALHGKSVPITTTAGIAQAGVQALQVAIAAIQGKTVQVRVESIMTQTTAAAKKHASGRGSGPGEVALVGEGGGPEYVINAGTGQGGLVGGPTLMGLGSQDYVVPTEDRYRGRALGLFAMLAQDLGVPGYKKGKGKEAPVHHAIPGLLDPLSLPVSELESKRDTAKTAYDGQHSHVKSLTAKGSKATKSQVAAAKKKEKEDHVALVNLQREAREAKAYQAKIDRETALVNIARNDMQLADNRGDAKGYATAKGQRIGALQQLQLLIGRALKHVAPGSPYALKLREELGNEELNREGVEGEGFASVSNKVAEAEENSGMTEAEERQLKQIEAGVSLAALTPDLGDDKARAQQLVSFLEGVLGEVQSEPGARGGDSSIKSIADAVKSARGNLESLSGGTATNENADLQAQITQANERAELSARQTQIAEGALAVFGGPGDIGAGGQNARAAVIQNVYTLHPGDPRTLSAIGAAATAGIGLQGSRRAVRQTVGP